MALAGAPEGPPNLASVWNGLINERLPGSKLDPGRAANRAWRWYEAKAETATSGLAAEAEGAVGRDSGAFCAWGETSAAFWA